MKINHLIMASAVAMALAACNKESGDAYVSQFPEDGVLRVTTSVNEAVLTRASITTDDLDDFYLNFNTTGAPKYTYSDVKVEKKTVEDTYKWELKPTDDHPLYLWKDNSTEVTFEAVKFADSKFADIVGKSLAIPTDQTLQDDLYSADLLYMPLTTIEAPGTSTLLSNGQLQISLFHQLAKLDITLDLSNEFLKAGINSEDMIADFQINGTKTGFQFTKGATPSVTAEGEAEAVKAMQESITIATATSNAQATYEVILVPQAVENNQMSISFKVGDTEYVWRLAEGMTFESGNLYTLALKVGKEVVIIEGMSSSEWEPGSANPSNINTD